MAEQELRNKTVKGVGWSFADSILGQGVTFVVGLLLARLISPDEYGLIGIILVFITVLDSVVDSGFSNAIIRKKDVTNDDYNTMFFTNMAISVVLFCALFFSANLIADFFGRVELVPLTQVMATIIIIHALSLTQYTMLTKRLDFKTRMKASVISSLSSACIGIVLAFYGFGVWALAWQQISRRLINTICLWILNHWLPTLRFNMSSFRYMWGFGWKLLVSTLINNLWNELYQVVVGKFYSPATLGQYTRSTEFAKLFSTNLTSVVQRVSYPALSQIQDEKERMVAAYRKVIKVTMFVTFVTMISMGAVAEPLIYCLVGPNWHQASTFLPFVCVSMLFYPLHAINLNMLQVQGRSDIYLKLEIIKKAIAIMPLCIGIFIDIYWMLAASVVGNIVCFFLNTAYTGKKLNYTGIQQLLDVRYSFYVACCIALGVYFLKYLPLSYYLILPLQVIVGIIIFFLTVTLFHMEEFSEIKQMILTFAGKKKH